MGHTGNGVEPMSSRESDTRFRGDAGHPVTASGATPHRSRGRRTSFIALVIAYFLVAAASFNGFYVKEGFQDDSRFISAGKIMDGSAIRPFVFRRLDAEIANFAALHVPDRLKQAIRDRYVHNGKSAIGPDAALAGSPTYFIAYNVLFYLVFAQFLASLFVLRGIFGKFVSPLAASITPALWALLMPVIQARSAGLFYDYAELLFLSSAVLAAIEGRTVVLVILTILGTYNKETFLVFIPALLPFLLPALGKARATITACLCMAISAGLYLLVNRTYAANAGFDADPNWLAALRFYPNPLNLLLFDKAYGLYLPRIWGIFWLAAGATIVSATWARADRRLRQHLLIAAVINLPLLVLFGAPGELRNLSLCFVGVAGLLAYAVDGWVRDTPDTRPVEEAQG